MTPRVVLPQASALVNGDDEPELLSVDTKRGRAGPQRRRGRTASSTMTASPPTPPLPSRTAILSRHLVPTPPSSPHQASHRQAL
uniref:Uncharacterized protein n=1 Tax=Setaria viridis TaxID=4556 RepID=A0A4U6UHQ3_SETVI|nr:hypothetical protein SEVIR_5G172500v2 [Setaria viridis]